jgi:hypothetical protein
MNNFALANALGGASERFDIESGKSKEFKDYKHHDKRKIYPDDSLKTKKENNMNDLSKLSKTDLIKLLGQMQNAMSNDLTVRLTSTTNLYIRSPKLQAYSEKKSKYYTYGLNINYEAAKVLFNDESLLSEIKNAINNL